MQIRTCLTCVMQSIGSTVRSRKRAQPPEGGAEGGKTEDNPANEGPSKVGTMFRGKNP